MFRLKASQKVIATKDSFGADSLYLLFLSSKCLFISFLSVYYSPWLCFSSDLLVFVISSFQLCTAYSVVFHFPYFLTPSYSTPALLSLLFSTLSLPLSPQDPLGRGGPFSVGHLMEGQVDFSLHAGSETCSELLGLNFQRMDNISESSRSALEMSG